jgi:hypothetical protein
MTEHALDLILQHPGVWRGGRRDTGGNGIPTGFRSLDPLLPGGWPGGSLTELLIPHAGVGELRLVMPALAHLSHRGRWLTFIAPPYVPYAPALAGHGVDLSRLLVVHPSLVKDALWSIEQALAAGTCGAVLAWVERADFGDLRRLQLAAAQGGTWGLLFRPRRAAYSPSPAALRLAVESMLGGIAVAPVKQRSGTATPVAVELEPPCRPAAAKQ